MLTMPLPKPRFDGDDEDKENTPPPSPLTVAQILARKAFRKRQMRDLAVRNIAATNGGFFLEKNTLALCSIWHIFFKFRSYDRIEGEN